MVLPPSLSGQPPIGSSPASLATGNPGANAAALAKVREAVRILEIALPDLPHGSPEHKAVLNAISGMSKHAPAAEAQPGIQISAMRELQQQASQQAPLMALMRQFAAREHAAQPAPGGAVPAQPAAA